MTRDEILSMQPGPELNAAVAVSLFGWRWITTPDAPIAMLLPPDVAAMYPLKFLATTCPEGKRPNYGGCPDFQTWEGMRLVVEAMAAKGWYASLQWPIGPSWDGKCYAVFVDSTNVRSGTHTAETAPHAARLAALLAMEGEHAG